MGGGYFGAIYFGQYTQGQQAPDLDLHPPYGAGWVAQDREAEWIDQDRGAEWDADEE